LLEGLLELLALGLLEDELGLLELLLETELLVLRSLEETLLEGLLDDGLLDDGRLEET